MPPSGLAQRYLAAIQNSDKEQWQPDSLQLSSSSESTYSDDKQGHSESIDDDLCYFQTRNGSNSPSRLRVRDSNSSCHSRDSVSSEEDQESESMVLDEFRETQNKWKHFRNAMKQRSASAVVEKNDDTDQTSVKNDHDEAVSDVYPPTEVINNVSMHWKQKELHKWKHCISASRKSTSPSLARFNQGTKNDRGWIRNDDTSHFTTKKPMLTPSVSPATKSFFIAENDSIDNKNLPQHKVGSSDQTIHDVPTSSSSQPVSSPWAVKLRPVKNIKSKSTVGHYEENNNSNTENSIPLTDEQETEETTKDVHREKWNGRNTTNYSNTSTIGTNSNGVDYSWMKANDLNSTNCSQKSPKKDERQDLGLNSNPSRPLTVAPRSPVMNYQSPIRSKQNLRQSSSWIKSSSVGKELSPHSSQTTTSNKLKRTDDPDRTDLTQAIPPTRPRNIYEKNVGRRSLSLNSVRYSSTNTMGRNSPNFDVTKHSISDVESPNLSSHREKIGKTVSEVGVPTTSVRNIRSLFELKSINDRPPRQQASHKGKDNQISSKKFNSLYEKADDSEAKTGAEKSLSNIKNETKHFAPKTLKLIQSKLVVRNCDMVNQKQNGFGAITQNSCVLEKHGFLESKSQHYSPSDRTGVISSLKSKFESPQPSKFITSKSFTQKMTEYEDEIHQAPTDETDGSKSKVKKSTAANKKIDTVLKNANTHSSAFESLRNKFNGSNSDLNLSSTNLKVSNTFSGGESTFNSLCIETESPGDQEANSISKVRPIPQKPSNDIGKQSAFTAYQQRSNVTPAASEGLLANDIPWDSKTPNDIPWHDRELQDDKVDNYMHEISMLTDKRVIDMSYGIEYLDCSLDDDDGDGVTLSPHPSDVSSLSIPSCIQSLDAVTSDDDTGAIESITEKQSSVLGPSEASSSQMSESAKPLIYSALGTMGRTFPMKSSSDTSQSFSVQYTGLLNALPPSIDNSRQVAESGQPVDEKIFFTDSKDQKSRESTDVNNQFEDELRVHPGPEWKNDLFAIDSVKSHTSGDDIRWAEFPDTNFDGYHGSNTTLSSENHSGSFGVLSRKTSADTSSKSSRSTSSPKPDHRKTFSSERIKTPTLPVVRECNLESSVIKHGSSSSSDQRNVVPMESGKDSTDGRVSAYRRFNIQKVRAFQQFRRSKSYNN